MTLYEFFTTKAEPEDVAEIILKYAEDPCLLCVNSGMDKRMCVRLNQQLHNACFIGVADWLRKADDWNQSTPMEEIKNSTLENLADWFYGHGIIVARPLPPYGYIGEIDGVKQWLMIDDGERRAK